MFWGNPFLSWRDTNKKPFEGSAKKGFFQPSFKTGGHIFVKDRHVPTSWNGSFQAQTKSPSQH